MSRQTPVSVTQQFPDLKRWEQSTVLEAPSSSELMAGSKIFGRECSNVYVSFLKCKMEKGEHPGVCINESQLNILCTKNV